MSAFKLLAIRPLMNCSRRFLKILKEGELYKFYNDYEYKIDLNQQVVNIIPLQKTPRDLYNIQTSSKTINVNISAIVGKNGSGKSSLVELLFMVINNIAKPYIPNDTKPLYNVVEDINDCLNVELYFETTSIYKVVVFDDSKTQSIKAFKLVNSSFVKDDGFNLKDLFYTIAVNYSVYSLDSRELGDWLTEVFHKNDSYQTPLVLNPFRKEGNINYESEKGLINDRLLTNVLRKKKIEDSFDFRMLTEKQKVDSIELELNSTDYNSKILYTSQDISSKSKRIQVASKGLVHYKPLLFKILSQKLNFDFEQVDKTIEVNNKALDYIFYKTFKIAEVYKTNFGNLFDFETKMLIGRVHPDSLKKDSYRTQIDEYLNRLFVYPGTHITNKIRQTINFLKFNSENKIGVSTQLTLGVDDLSKNIDEMISLTKSKDTERIEFIPPPIYDVDYNLTSISNTNGLSTKFSLLSSGEKQKIHSVSSIIYHLINIDSVIENGSIIQYKNVNIIFEEIELYFHPDMQRTFVKFLYDSIRNISLKSIDSINISLVTHSPFILSDIPNTNILYLDIQKKELQDFRAYPQSKDVNTFGANIHELLSDSFFMANGYMGEFAKLFLQKIIADLKDVEYKNQESLLSRIQIIGEPIIKERLEKMFNDKFRSIELLEQRIKSMQEELKRMREK